MVSYYVWFKYVGVRFLQEVRTIHCRDVFDFSRHVQVTLVGCHRTSAAACKYFHENVLLENKDVAPESIQTALQGATLYLSFANIKRFYCEACD